jgi:hypothetical protein
MSQLMLIHDFFTNRALHRLREKSRKEKVTRLFISAGRFTAWQLAAQLTAHLLQDGENMFPRAKAAIRLSRSNLCTVIVHVIFK